MEKEKNTTPKKRGGKRITSKNFKYILNKYNTHNNIDIFIETGTHHGWQSEIANESNVFKRVYGIELNEHWYKVTQELNPTSIIIHGDTVKELPKLLSKYHDTPLFIYLDAHYCHTSPPIPKSKFPLWEELKMINDRNMGDIVAIDDIHTFGKNRDKLRFDDDSKEWETVTEKSIKKFFGKRVKDSEALNDALVLWLDIKG